MRLFKLRRRFRATRNASRIATAHAVSLPHHVYRSRFFSRPRVAFISRSSRASVKSSDSEFHDTVFSGIADARTYFPDISFNPQSSLSRPLLSVARKPIKRQSKVIASPSNQVVPSGRRAEHLRFAVPAQVIICVRRRQRRQVLFAFGKGGSGHRKPQWKADSYIRC